MSEGLRRALAMSRSALTAESRAMDRRRAGFSSLPDDCVASVLALVPFRER